MAGMNKRTELESGGKMEIINTKNLFGPIPGMVNHKASARWIAVGEEWEVEYTCPLCPEYRFVSGGKFKGVSGVRHYFPQGEVLVPEQ